MKSQNANLKKINVGITKGITLITLVITIIILIILSNVAIYLVLGNNGIIKRAKQAKEETNKQTATEIINLKITTAQMNSYIEKQKMPTLKELSIALKEDKEIEYVTEKSQIASTKYEVGEEPSSIYTKLDKYPYEFEINAALQLASINGIKIAENSIKEQEIKGCNPKLLTSINLPYSRENERQTGDYYANTEIFTKTNTSEFSNYLSFDAETGWKILKSGYYMINSNVQVGYSQGNYSDTANFIIYNTNQIKLSHALVNKGAELSSNRNSSTIFLDKGTNINFMNNIFNNAVIYHLSEIEIYALSN